MAEEPIGVKIVVIFGQMDYKEENRIFLLRDTVINFMIQEQANG